MVANEKNNSFSCRTKWFVVGIIFLASFFGAVFGFMAGGVVNVLNSKSFFGRWGNSSISERIINTQNIITEDSVVADVVNQSSPAVVSIAISKEVSNLRNFDFFGFIPGENSGQKQQVGAGSGFFVSEDGMIVTNRHVVEDMSAEYTVVTNDGTEFPAKVLARDPVHDIAIIKIEGVGFPVLPLGDSDSVQIGQTVIAIGNSLGEFSNTVSRGIISGLGRTVIAGSELGTQAEKLTDIVQTDAAINPGNSGGPLINVKGEVIGMNVAMAQGAQNIGFALPINQVKQTVDQVKQTGKISTPFLGVRYIPISEEIQDNNNLPFDYGILIQRGTASSELAVVPGSPADKAGILENDIILEVDGQKIDDKNQLGDLIADHKVGDLITLKVWSKGTEKDVQVVLGERN